MFTEVSLNGYKNDFYFFLATLFLNLICFCISYKQYNMRRRSRFNLSVISTQIVGLCLFLWLDSLQVDKVYTPSNTKHNLYSSIIGYYKRAYFKRHKGELCGEGELWQTEVLYDFPIIEVETKRDKCHQVGTDSTYHWAYLHIPE